MNVVPWVGMLLNNTPTTDCTQGSICRSIAGICWQSNRPDIVAKCNGFFQLHENQIIVHWRRVSIRNIQLVSILISGIDESFDIDCLSLQSK